MRIIWLIILIAGTLALRAQTADELNQQARIFLSAGDTKNAVSRLEKAADMGHPEAQFNLAVLYQRGMEVEKNDSIAHSLLLRSAAQGFVDAQFKVSYNYAVGRGCKSDMEQAYYWSLKCALQNDAECMWNVVNCYSNGIGVRQSTDSMIAWAGRLGALPDAEDLNISMYITNARLNLARTYAGSPYVQKSFPKSYMWYLIYNESKRDHSIAEQQHNIQAMLEIEKSLTAEERSALKAEAEKLIGRPLTNWDNLYKEDW